jgi:hypothetical protein
MSRRDDSLPAELRPTRDVAVARNPDAEPSQAGAIRLIRALPAPRVTPPPHHLPGTAGVDTIFRVTNDVTPSPLPVAIRCQLSGVAEHCGPTESA